MALDLNEAQRQLEANVKKIARLHANQYRNRCHACKRPVNPENETWDNKGNWYHMDCLTICAGCEKPIPPQDIRTQDSEGHDVCLACGDNPSAAQEAADRHRDMEEDR